MRKPTALTLLALAAAALSQLASAEVVNLDPKAFADFAQTQDALVLDVRTPQEIARGKIESARALDFYSEQFDEELAALQRDKPILVYCRSGRRSLEAAQKLEALGHEKVYNLQGGFNAWQEKGLPISQADTSAKSAPPNNVDTSQSN